MDWKDRFVKTAAEDWNSIGQALMTIRYNYDELQNAPQEPTDNELFKRLDQALDYVKSYFSDHNDLNPSFLELKASPNWKEILQGYRTAIRIFNDSDFGYYNPNVANKMHRGWVRIQK